MKPILIFTICLLPMLGTLRAENRQRSDRPNILIIFTDDHDFHEVNALRPFSDSALAGQKPGQQRPLLTPHLDRLVGQSRVFTQFHMASVVCTPSRYCLLTGQYGSRARSLVRQHPVSGPANVEFNTDIEAGQWHLARGLKEAGYTTAIVGKWHNTDERRTDVFVRPPIADYTGKEFGSQDPLLPENARRVRAAYDAALRHLREDIGWDFASSVYLSNANTLGLPRSLWQVENNMEWFTAGAVKFLESRKGAAKPFFLYFAPNIPHGGGRRFLDADPRATPEGLVDWHLGVQPSRADVLRRVTEAGGDTNSAWATWLDDGIGVVLQKLEDLGLAESTLVLFSSDQQSRGKWTCYEGARVWLTARWFGRIAPGTRDDTLLGSIDLVPTLLDLAAAKAPEPGHAVLDGRSFAPALTGGSVTGKPVLIEMGYGRAILSSGWKYIACRYPARIEAQAAKLGKQPDFLGRFREDKLVASTWPSYGQRDQLFDLKADPLEQTNLAADPAHAAKLAEMRTLLTEALAPLPHVFGEFKPTAGK